MAYHIQVRQLYLRQSVFKKYARTLSLTFMDDILLSPGLAVLCQI